MITQIIHYPIKRPGYTKDINPSHKLGALSFWNIHNSADVSKGFRVKLFYKYYLHFINKYGFLTKYVVHNKSYLNPFGWFITRLEVVI